MCEELGLATGVQNQYDDTKTYIIVLMFDSSSVLVVVVIRNLEGERDHCQQRLATYTFLKSSFRRGVVHMVLKFVKLRGVNRTSVFCVTNIRTVVYTFTGSRFARARTTQILYFIVWCGRGPYVFKGSVWPIPNNEMHMLKFFWPCAQCLWWAYKTNVHVSYISWISHIRYALRGPSDICI